MQGDNFSKTIVDSAPFIFIDILLKKDNKVLSGKKTNKPAQGYFSQLVVGLKNEVINRAMERIVKDKLNIELKSTPEFISVFENFYDDSIFNDISTHYVNLAYEYEVGEIDNLSIEQHNEYK